MVLGDRGRGDDPDHDHDPDPDPDPDEYRRPVRDLGVKPLIARRGTRHGSGPGTQRRVVERAFAHPHWFRRLRIRWEILGDLHGAFLASDAH
ncbi:IS5/IS1182 family transposase, partial [Streptomyces sp. NPDC004266]